MMPFDEIRTGEHAKSSAPGAKNSPARAVRLYAPAAVGLGCLLALTPQAALAATAAPMDGAWREPGGSVIRIAPCGSDLCAQLVAIEADAPSPFDLHNPDPSRRHDRLCGLQIGYGFHPTGPDHAEGGHLYDPKSGKTYQGEWTATGDRLSLRGYMGVKWLGRTEQWTRVQGPVPPCPTGAAVDR